MECFELSLRHLIFTLPLLLEVEPEIKTVFEREKCLEMWGKHLNLTPQSVVLFRGIISKRKFAEFLRGGKKQVSLVTELWQCSGSSAKVAITQSTGEASAPPRSRARAEPEQHLRKWRAQGLCPRLTAGLRRPSACLPLTLASSPVDVRRCWTHRARNTAPMVSGGHGPWRPGEVQRRGLPNHARGLWSSGEVPPAGNQEKFLASQYLPLLC